MTIFLLSFCHTGSQTVIDLKRRRVVYKLHCRLLPDRTRTWNRQLWGYDIETVQASVFGNFQSNFQKLTKNKDDHENLTEFEQ